MTISEEVKERRNNLKGELTEASRREFILAKSAYIWSQGLFILALLCSVAAVAIGLFLNVSAKVVSGIAALPPLIAFVAVNLKLEARSSWHYRKGYAIDELHSRLMYRLPEAPTVDNVDGIARARDQLVSEMEREWDRTITVSWGEMLKQRPSAAAPQSSESSPPQAPVSRRR